MLTLYTTPPLWGLLSPSPPAMKLEVWLRMAQLPYQTQVIEGLDAAPKGKIPFIDYQGQFIGDSTLIIERFKQQEGIDLDASLSPAERAISLGLRRMLKEHTYWGIAYIRYGVEANWQIYRQAIATMLGISDPAIWEPIAEGFRQTFQVQSYNHGLGRHREAEIVSLIQADFQALADFLADKPFLMGEQPTTVDATAYSYIANTIKPPLPSPIVDYVLQQSNLCQYCDRMAQKFGGPV